MQKHPLQSKTLWVAILMPLVTIAQVHYHLFSDMKQEDLEQFIEAVALVWGVVMAGLRMVSTHELTTKTEAPKTND